MTAVALPTPRVRRGTGVVVLATTTVAMTLAGLVLHAWPGTPPVARGITDWWLLPVAAAVGYGAAGVWVSRVRPDLPVGLLLVLLAWAQALSLLTQEAGVRAVDGSATPMWAVVALWVGVLIWLPALLCIPAVLPLLLPEGRVPADRLPALRLAQAALGLTALQWAFQPFDVSAPPLSRYGVDNPFAIAVVDSAVFGALVATVSIASIVVSCGGLVRRWRQSTDDVHQQLSWVVYGVALSAVLFAAGFGLGPVCTALALLPLPIACAVGVLRFGLWDVDVVVSRSLVYGLLTACVVAVYAGSVGLLGGLLGRTTGAPILATALVAVGVEPMHTRLRAIVNRLVHGGNDDPYVALSRIGQTLGAARDAAALSEEVLPEVLVALSRALHLPYVALVLADGTRVEHGASDAPRRELPLTYGGRSVGTLVVAERTGGSTPVERRLLSDLAQQAAVAAHTVGLTHELGRSREALVTAREEERRRLHNDLHDGLGPALAALALQVETARDLVTSDPEAARSVLDRALPRLAGTVAGVRELVQGLRPPALDDLGLDGALRELAVRFTTPTLDVSADVSLPDGVAAAVEVAVYRIASEAVTNVVRHAHASRVDMAVTRSRDGVQLVVTDDGCGYGEAVAPGTGLRSMRERAEELGGTFVVRTSPAGTTVCAEIPT